MPNDELQAKPIGGGRSKEGEKFNAIEIERIHRELGRRGWALRNFLDLYKERNPDQKLGNEGWGDHIERLLSGRRPAQSPHRGAIAITFGCTLERFEAYLRGEVASLDPSSGEYQLKAPAPDFEGREEELSIFTAALTKSDSKGPCIAMIWGLPGAGKTQLARRLAYDVRAAFPDAQLLFNLPNDTKLANSVRDELERQVRLLMPRRGSNLPRDIEGLGAIYREFLANKKALVVLDNASRVADVEPLIPPPGCAMIVTSRSNIPLEGRGITRRAPKVTVTRKMGSLRQKVCYPLAHCFWFVMLYVSRRKIAS